MGRWTRDSKHGLSSVDAESLLDHLRACAWAPSVTPDENQLLDHHYQQAVSVLKSSNLRGKKSICFPVAYWHMAE